ncbi:hypothetical protein J4218_04530 [Candidatus Pacearchaeota archaeon]|nr:hypothetical protein [Candidatus Pacearchaeota archaeon]
MTIDHSPVSIVREGYFPRDILNQLRRYCDNFKPLPAKSTHEKYGLYVPETPSLLVVSKLRGDRRLGPNGVNLYAAFTSYSEQGDLEMIADFEARTGINVQSAHPNLRLIGMIMELVFEEIFRKGPQAMDILARM